MVMVDVDSNAIIVEPMKNRKDNEMIRAYDALVKRLLRAGAQRTTQKTYAGQRNITQHEGAHQRQIQIHTRASPTGVP
jgi:hypothetical protein